MPWYVARSSTLATSRRRSPPPTPSLRPGAGRASRPCQRPAGGRAVGHPTSCSGPGKTAADACIWLLNGVEPDRIRWIRPRDAWFYDRGHFQPLEQVGAIMEGISLDAEAGAEAADIDDLFERLEASGRLVRIDPSWPATMFRGTMLSAPELEALGKSRMSSGSVGCAASSPAGSSSSVARPETSVTSCMWIALRSGSMTPPPADLPAPSDRGPAGAAPLAVVQRGPHRLRRGPPGRRCRQEPALPAEPVPEPHRGLAAHGESHLEDGAAVVERARHLGWVAQSRLNLLRALPDHLAEPSVQTAARALPHSRRPRDRAAPAARRVRPGRSRLTCQAASASAGAPRAAATRPRTAVPAPRRWVSTSGCHCTPRQNRRAGSHTASTVESAATAHTCRPAPTLSTAWWWYEFTPRSSSR